MTERKSLRRKLQESRYRLLTRAPELAYPMLKMLFVATKDVYRISTNGSCIYFDAAWLDKLPEWSLDYALCHQMMHIRLDHLSRPRLYKGERFHYACNIIVNSHLVDYGFIEEKLPGIGELQRETLFPVVPGNAVTPLEAFGMCPFDPAVLSGGQRSRIVPDTDAWWDRPNDRGQDGVIVLSPDDPDPEDLIPSARISGEIERYLIPWATLKMPLRNISIETKETDDLDDFTTEYVTGPNMSLKETVSDLRSLKAREETEHSDDMRERVIREICVMAKDASCYLAPFLYKYFDEELEANRKRADADGFEWYLTYNFFTHESVTGILHDIRDTIDALSAGRETEYTKELKIGRGPVSQEQIGVDDAAQPREDDGEVSLVIDFYQRFLYRMEYMMKVGKEKGYELISFMGP